MIVRLGVACCALTSLCSVPTVVQRVRGCSLSPALGAGLAAHAEGSQASRQARCGSRVAALRMAEEEDAEDDEEEGGSLGRPNNPYVEAMEKIDAPALIKGFAETAPSEVQAAVRQTVVSLLGNLPPNVYDVNVMSTGQNVASLMYSMQMTGYMVRSACARRQWRLH